MFSVTVKKLLLHVEKKKSCFEIKRIKKICLERKIIPGIRHLNCSYHCTNCNPLYILFQTHGSVRVKGTENNYDPVVCQSSDPECVDKPLHMHCPFCTKAESFTDPVILRAHYRVKHVDKGIEFAGKLRKTYKLCT